MKLSIIIPAYFEEKNIISTIASIEAKVKTPHEIIVVCDLKEDPTLKVVQSYKNKQGKNNIFAVINSVSSGRGVINALKTGVKIAHNEAILVCMADLSDDYDKIDQMFEKLKKGSDIVCASRYMKGGRQIGGPFIKGLLSRTAGISAHGLFHLPTHDPTNSFKMFKKSVFNSIKIESTGGFEYNLEFVVKAFKKGYKITEVPATWRDRTAGKSRFKLLKWLPKYIKWYLFLLNNR